MQGYNFYFLAKVEENLKLNYESCAESNECNEKLGLECNNQKCKCLTSNQYWSNKLGCG
jgi:hypothetical protein